MVQTIGLTLGKYAPLHKGHQLVIETALREMDHVVVVIYDSPETTPIPLATRAAWIRELYPTVEVVEAWNGPSEVGDAPEITARHDQYLRHLLPGYRITHFYSSEFYGEHVSRAFQAVNRQVDPQRRQIPISATRIRADPFTHRHCLHPRVYRDLVRNVVFLGAPSTGKTTLAHYMAQQWNTVWMPEYGREYWDQHQVKRRLTQAQLLELAEGHLEREETCLYAANQVLFTDTNALTTYLFSLHYHGAALPGLSALAERSAHRYTDFFLCEDDIPYDDTWDRSGEVQRGAFQQLFRQELVSRGIPFTTLTGPLVERAATVNQVLQQAGLRRN